MFGKSYNFEAHEDVTKLNLSNISILEEKLSGHHTDDSYARSPGYYAFTGRKGLWLIQDKNCSVIFCLHPNVDDTILVFPSLGSFNECLAHKLITMIKGYSLKIEFARLTEPFKFGNLPITYHVEELLDWKFPIHSYSVQTLLDMKGRGFRQYRNYVNRCLRDGVTYRLANVQDSYLEINEFFHSVNLTQERDTAEWDTSSKFFLSALLKSHLNIELVVIEKFGKIIGMSVFEKPIKGRKTANILMVQTDRSQQGSFEFLYYAVANIMKDFDIEFYCDGGSEYEGLDAFKRKMQPIQSIQLMTGVL